MVEERFSRIVRMIGMKGLERLQRAQVVVVGLGAVGSYATEALARAGVGWLRLVDFDVIKPSNLNRQLYALESTLGQPKSALAARRVADINPSCRVEALNLFVHRETLDQVFAGPPHLVVDAIDSLNPKVELLAGARQRGILVISSMGAALRTNPAAIQVALLSNVSHCPLARRIRKELRQRGISTDFPCVYSTEPVSHLPSAALSREEAEEEPTARGRRRRTLGSLPTLTGIFGLILANAVLEVLTGDAFPYQRKGLFK